MSGFLKVTIVALLPRIGLPSLVTLETVFTSSKFHRFTIQKFREKCDLLGVTPVSFHPEPLHDSDIIECIKIREKDYPNHESEILKSEYNDFFG